jgi:hypothetical protein
MKNTIGIVTSGLFLLASASLQAQDHIGDTEIQGSLCVGLDCNLAESFGFYRVRIK